MSHTLSIQVRAKVGKSQIKDANQYGPRHARADLMVVTDTSAETISVKFPAEDITELAPGAEVSCVVPAVSQKGEYGTTFRFQKDTFAKLVKPRAAA